MLQCTVCSAPCAVCSLQGIDMQCTVFCVSCAVINVQQAVHSVCSVQSAVSSDQYVVCIVHCAVSNV